MFIKGVGMTKFGIQQEPASMLVHEAVEEALKKPSISMNEIDAVIVSNEDMTSNGERQRHSASMLSSLFQKRMPIIAVTAGCAGSGNALWSAVNIMKNSDYGNILVIGFEKMVSNSSRHITDEMMMGAERIYEQAEGMNFAAADALVTQQYMLQHGANTDDFALVAYKNHKNAYHNPKARFYKRSVSLDEIKISPVVASPLRLLDCSVPANGAAALVLSREQSDVELVASSQQTDCLSFEREDMGSWPATQLAAQEAYKQASITPNEISIAELHDAFTSVELISYEDLGFCKKGGAKELIRKGVTNIDGKLPVNTSGGLKAKGHPISATGISQIYELVKQMRNQCGERQVQNVKYGLAQNIGGAGSTVTVHILKNLGG